MPRSIVCSAAALLLLGAAAPAWAHGEDEYCLLMFASQRAPRDPDYAHSFAAFVRVGGAGPKGPGAILETHTISWFPAKLPVRTVALLPECGRNYELHETLRIVLESRERVSLWGPYRMDPELYQRAMRRITQLESGQVLYKANDAFYRSDRVSNCIHAISTLSESNRLRVLSPGWGDTASYFILLGLMPWIIDADRTHDWVACALGLDAYPIAYRQPPRRPLISPSTGFPLFLRDRFPQPTYGPPPVRGRFGQSPATP